tara:strand:- start:93 stop:362 length:270 start_codon:yes stop_codon:yes gene_type:complete
MKTHIFKNGKLITLRIPKIEEAQELLNLKKVNIKNDYKKPRKVENRSDPLLNDLNIIFKSEECSNINLLVAEFDSILIGEIDLNGSKKD